MISPSASVVTLLNPNLAVQPDDLFTTGIVYMPMTLAYLAGALREGGHGVSVVDAFGEAPNRWYQNRLAYRGLTPDEVAARVPVNTTIAMVYAGNVTAHQSVIEIIHRVRARFPTLPIAVLENAQAVTAYSLRRVQSRLHDAGADVIITGDLEEKIGVLLQILARGGKLGELRIPGVGGRTRDGDYFTEPPPPSDRPPVRGRPAWELFPLAAYWALRHSHGPFSTKRYLPISTSRGCPYPCRFCVIPDTNQRRWRGRPPEEVVDEIAFLKETFGVDEFHVEDVDPTVNNDRTRAFCNHLIERRLGVTWKICAGTKIETIKDRDTLALMARAGCRYISISPESGSPDVLRKINKPFNLEHAQNMIANMRELAIRSLACFRLGFPGETDADRALTADLVRKLARGGVDEIAVFIVAPIPGAAIDGEITGYTDYSDLTFSPRWRADYDALRRWRGRLYRDFLRIKATRFPARVAGQALNFLRRRFETKMEMAPYRAAQTWLTLHTPAGHRTDYVPLQIGSAPKKA
jgi:radical SAM superfamily enzyme YgiQ (UPF0313 family)